MVGDPRRRALVTLPDVAAPADSGRRLRTLGVLMGLSRRYELDVVVPLSLEPDAVPVPRDAAVRRWVALPPRDLSAPRAALPLARQKVPWRLAHAEWSAVRASMASWCEGTDYDLAWYGSTEQALELHGVVPAAHTIADLDVVESIQWEVYLRQRPRGLAGRADHLQRRIELPLWRRVEDEVVRNADVAVVADPDDVARVARLGYRNVHAIPNSYPDPGLLDSTSSPETPVLVLVGNFSHDPNREAARILAEDVLPAVRHRVPGARVRLIGRESEAIAHLGAREGVDVLGAVAEIAPHLRDATASVMPIRFGGGTRLKALEAFALGVPVIGTELAVTGLGAVAGTSYLRAETTEEFIAQTLALIADAGLATRIRTAARDLYDAGYTPSSSSDAIEALVEAWT